MKKPPTTAPETFEAALKNQVFEDKRRNTEVSKKALDEAQKSSDRLRALATTRVEYSRLPKSDRLALTTAKMVQRNHGNPDRAAMSFTLRLSPELIASTETQTEKEACQTFKRAIKRHLERRLKRNIAFWFTIERHDRGGEPTDPHVHGTIELAANELETVRRALRKVAGGSYAPPSAVSMFYLPTPKDGQRWANYALKNHSKLYVSQHLTKKMAAMWEVSRAARKRKAAA